MENIWTEKTIIIKLIFVLKIWFKLFSREGETPCAQQVQEQAGHFVSCLTPSVLSYSTQQCCLYLDLGYRTVPWLDFWLKLLGTDTFWLYVTMFYDVTFMFFFLFFHQTISIIYNQTVNTAFKSSLAKEHQTSNWGQRNKLYPILWRWNGHHHRSSITPLYINSNLPN